MPKKGERLLFRVLYWYPGQQVSRIPFRTLDEAESQAGEIGRNGGNATVVDGNEEVLASFGPETHHLYDLISQGHPDAGLFCRCGRRPRGDAQANDHMMRAGLCYVCEGTGSAGKKEAAEGHRPTWGNMTTCPVCQGSGKAEDVSFWDVDMDSFYSRREMLHLTAKK